MSFGEPAGAAFGDFDRSKYGLRQLKVAEKYGLVWVVPTALEGKEEASLDIDGYLGTLKADLCPECGDATLVYEEGCKKCYGCGYSEC